MWVVQYRQYPFPAGLKVVRYDQHLRAVFDKTPLPPPHHTPGADCVTVFEDTDGDGTYDTHKDVITGLNIATSAAVTPEGIWVMNPPYLLFYPDLKALPDDARAVLSEALAGTATTVELQGSLFMDVLGLDTFVVPEGWSVQGTLGRD